MYSTNPVKKNYRATPMTTNNTTSTNSLYIFQDKIVDRHKINEYRECLYNYTYVNIFQFCYNFTRIENLVSMDVLIILLLFFWPFG